MKYYNGSGHIIKVEYKDYDGFEFGEHNKTLIFTDYGLAYNYFKMAVQKAMYDHETEIDNEGGDIDACIEEQDAIFDKVHITWDVATLVKRDDEQKNT